MNRELFFVGRTEKYLIQKIKDDGVISSKDIFACYASPSAAQSFMQKLLNFKIARLSAPGTFELVK